jgi:hypothetical protein
MPLWMDTRDRTGSAAAGWGGSVESYLAAILHGCLLMKPLSFAILISLALPLAARATPPRAATPLPTYRAVLRDLPAHTARAAAARDRVAQLQGRLASSLGAPDQLAATASALDALHLATTSRFCPPTAPAEAGLRRATAALIDASPLLRSALATPAAREGFASRLARLAHETGVMMSGRAQPTIAARLVYRALEQTSERRSSGPLRLLKRARAAERSALELTELVTRAQSFTLRRAAAAYVDQMVERTPALVERHWGDYDSNAAKVTDALRSGGYSLERYYPRGRLSSLAADILAARGTHARRRVLIQHLAGELSADPPNVPELKVARDRVREARKAYDWDLARVLRIYSTELK